MSGGIAFTFVLFLTARCHAQTYGDVIDVIATQAGREFLFCYRALRARDMKLSAFENVHSMYKPVTCTATQFV